MADLPELDFAFQIRYLNDRPIPARDISDALLAMDEIARTYLRRALSLLTETDITRVNVTVRGFNEGSFIEDLVLSFLFKDDASRDKFLAAVRKGRLLSGAREMLMDMPRTNQMIVGVVLAALIYYAFPVHADREPANQVTINIFGAEVAGTTPEKFTQAIETASRGDIEELRKNVAHLVAPAGLEHDASIDLGRGNPSLLLRGEVIHAALRERRRPFRSPDFRQLVSDLRMSEDTVRVVEQKTVLQKRDYPGSHRSSSNTAGRVILDATISIHASDRDSSKRGWFGVVDGVIPIRTKIVLGRGVSASRHVGAAKLVADITVFDGPEKAGRPARPRLIRIDKVHKDVR